MPEAFLPSSGWWHDVLFRRSFELIRSKRWLIEPCESPAIDCPELSPVCEDIRREGKKKEGCWWWSDDAWCDLIERCISEIRQQIMIIKMMIDLELCVMYQKLQAKRKEEKRRSPRWRFDHIIISLALLFVLSRQKSLWDLYLCLSFLFHFDCYMVTRRGKAKGQHKLVDVKCQRIRATTWASSSSYLSFERLALDLTPKTKTHI